MMLLWPKGFIDYDKEDDEMHLQLKWLDGPSKIACIEMRSLFSFAERFFNLCTNHVFYHRKHGSIIHLYDESFMTET